MPLMRGVFAGLGAGLCLAAAGACALLAISAVIAIEGWPGVGRADDSPTLVLSEVTVPRADPSASTAPAEAIVVSAPAVDAPGAGASGTTAVTDRAAPSGSDGGFTSSASPRSAPVTREDAPVAQSDGGGDADSAPPAPTRSRPADPVRRVTAGTGEAVEKTGEAVAPTVDRLIPGAGQAVEKVTGTLGSTVEGAGDGLGTVVDRGADGVTGVVQRSAEVVRGVLDGTRTLLP